jgi:hypothetical protein
MSGRSLRQYSIPVCSIPQFQSMTLEFDEIVLVRLGERYE